MIALGILAVLTAIAVPLFVGYKERTRIKQAVNDLRIMQAGIRIFRDEFGAPPNQMTQALESVPKDPWGNDYVYLNLVNGAPGISGMRRKDKNLVPINSEYDLYSKGADGQSQAPLTSPVSHDDVIRANDGAYMGLAEDY